MSQGEPSATIVSEREKDPSECIGMMLGSIPGPRAMWTPEKFHENALRFGLRWIGLRRTGHTYLTIATYDNAPIDVVECTVEETRSFLEMEYGSVARGMAVLRTEMAANKAFLKANSAEDLQAASKLLNTFAKLEERSAQLLGIDAPKVTETKSVSVNIKEDTLEKAAEGLASWRQRMIEQTPTTALSGPSVTQTQPTLLIPTES